MSRRKKAQDAQHPPKSVDPPKPRSFVPRPCCACAALRPAGSSYSKVYHTRGTVRYCKCEFCGNTWTQFFETCTSNLVQVQPSVVTTVIDVPSSLNGISSIATSTD